MGVQPLMWWKSNELSGRSLRHNNFLLLVLGLITFLALFLRTVSLDKVPAGFNWDEAALGYNAYSILKTGKDEYGEWFPLIFKSFGDYKPGLYVYLTIPFIAIIGLTELATRLPSIVLGSLIPCLAFLIVYKISQKTWLGIMTAFLIAVSPWAIHFSRGAWETNVSFFINLLAFYCLLLAKDRQKKYLILAALLLVLSIFCYQSAKLFCVLLFVGFVGINKSHFLTKKSLSVLLISSGLIIGALLISVADPEARSRLTVLSQYSYKRTDVEITSIKNQSQIDQDRLFFSIFHSEDLEYLKTISGHYLNYYLPRFLFIKGALDGRQGAIGYGVMHLVLIPFYLAGLFFLFKDKKYYPIILWFLISPIPGALSRDITSTIRALPLVFGLEFIAGLGIYELLYVLKRYRKSMMFVVGTFLVILLVNYLYFWDIYTVHSRKATSQDFLYGHKEMISFVKQNKNKYNKIIITTGFNEPYIFYLFYTAYDPTKFQNQAVLVKNRGVDVGEVPSIDNIEFRQVYWPDDRGKKGNLYVGRWIELPEQDIDPKQAKLLKTIKFLDNEIAFRIVETLKE